MSATECGSITLNPDIAGIGIRLSLYILSLAGPIVAVSVSSNELFEAIERSLAVTGFAVLLTTFISAGQGTLDLFHALLVLHLVGLTGFSVQPSWKQMRSKRILRVLSFFLYYAGLLAFCAFTIYIFASAPNFGSDPQCNSEIQYVLFGFAFPAVNYEFRWLFISAMIVVLFSTCFALPFMACFGFDAVSGGKAKLRYVSFVGDLAGRAYIIAMLELIIRKNNVSADASDWSFGQILAMMMLIGPLVELISLFTPSESEQEVKSKVKFNESDSIDQGGLMGDRTIRLILQFVFSILDLAFNAAAGAAAAATGAHVNGSELTPEILSLGALAGVLKSGVLNYSLLVSQTASNSISMGILFVTSTFGMAFIVTLAIGQRTIGSVPDSLLIAALAAGAPLTAGAAMAAAGSVEVSIIPLQPGWDALAGYTFVAVAHNNGYDVCSGATAAAAGGVFGVLVWFCNIPFSCYQQMTREQDQMDHA